MIEDLQSRGYAPDGIGAMGHLTEPTLPSMEELEATMDRFTQLVPRLQITELDVRTDDAERAAT